MGYFNKPLYSLRRHILTLEASFIPIIPKGLSRYISNSFIQSSYSKLFLSLKENKKHNLALLIVQSACMWALLLSGLSWPTLLGAMILTATLTFCQGICLYHYFQQSKDYKDDLINIDENPYSPYQYDLSSWYQYIELGIFALTMIALFAGYIGLTPMVYGLYCSMAYILLRLLCNPYPLFIQHDLPIIPIYQHFIDGIKLFLPFLIRAALSLVLWPFAWIVNDRQLVNDLFFDLDITQQHNNRSLQNLRWITDAFIDPAIALTIMLALLHVFGITSPFGFLLTPITMGVVAGMHVFLILAKCYFRYHETPLKSSSILSIISWLVIAPIRFVQRLVNTVTCQLCNPIYTADRYPWLTVGRILVLGLILVSNNYPEYLLLTSTMITPVYALTIALSSMLILNAILIDDSPRSQEHTKEPKYRREPRIPASIIDKLSQIFQIPLTYSSQNLVRDYMQQIRRLSKAHHPDKVGGSEERQVKLNNLKGAFGDFQNVMDAQNMNDLSEDSVDLGTEIEKHLIHMHRKGFLEAYNIVQKKAETEPSKYAILKHMCDREYINSQEVKSMDLINSFDLIDYFLNSVVLVISFNLLWNLGFWGASAMAAYYIFNVLMEIPPVFAVCQRYRFLPFKHQYDSRNTYPTEASPLKHSSLTSQPKQQIALEPPLQQPDSPDIDVQEGESNHMKLLDID